MSAPVTLVVPYGKRPLHLELPPDAARWLRDELIRAIGASKPRRPVRLRRGRWQNRRRSR